MNVEIELKNGNRRKIHPQVAKVLIRRGIASEVRSGSYLTRDMRASESMRDDETKPAYVPAEDSTEEAPYGFKADGTPRKRPGRSKAEE